MANIAPFSGFYGDLLQWKHLKSGRSAAVEDPEGQHGRVHSLPDGSPNDPKLYSLPELRLPSDVSRVDLTTSDIHNQQPSWQPSGSRQRKRPQDKSKDPLGLWVLHKPQNRSVDILFIHGLGGTSLRTWCSDRDLDNLWPQLWLPAELPSARIVTFGYNAHFSSRKEQASLSIGDFATDLLFRMKYEDSGPERFGQVPIIIVAHSMGGLVFKKAFIQGLLNDEFHDIISHIKASLFLATPHRGTDLAKALNRILSGSVFGHSPKEYVTELTRGSPTIDELNESFRHHSSKLQIFSFYETLATSVGPVQFMIVEKSSSVMGYPNETRQPLNANHHNVCKFTGAKDPNYASVVGALRSAMASITSPEARDEVAEEQERLVKELFGVAGPPLDDLMASRALRKDGTCEKILATDQFKSWMTSGDHPLLWAHAPPGSGKSTVAAYVVDHLTHHKRLCAFYFFKRGNIQRRSSASMLRSIALQVAICVPGFRQQLADLVRSGMTIQKEDGIEVWRSIFLDVLATIKSEEPVFWIIDGLDEADLSKDVIGLIAAIDKFEMPIRVLAFSRPLSSINQSFQLAKSSISSVDMPLPNTTEDIHLVVAAELQHLPWADDFKKEVTKEVVTRSNGSFLWASLVLRRLIVCHRQEQVARVLSAIPDEMEEFYDRMLDAIVALDTPEDKALSKIFLSWAMYASSPISVEELTHAYTREMQSIMDFKHTIDLVCGQFVTIDSQNRVVLVHHSARQYLETATRQPFSLESATMNEELFGKCIVALCDKTLRGKIHSLKLPVFLPYAATSWAFHLEHSSAASDRILDALLRFLDGPNILAWLQYMAMSGHLAELFRCSRRLTEYVRQRKRIEVDRPPMLCRPKDLALIELWAVDLIRIPAKFGSQLSRDPACIYKTIPPLSPSASFIHQKFSKAPSTILSVSGIHNVDWDDCLARVSAGTGRAILVAASPRYFAVCSDLPDRIITLWDTNLFRKHKTFNTGEYPWAMAFDQTGSWFACYGMRNTYIWRIQDGILQSTIINPSGERALELKFREDGHLMVITDLRRVYSLHATNGDHTPPWTRSDCLLMEEPGVPEGVFLGSPCDVSFNKDCTQIAVTYRNFPLSIWDVSPPKLVTRLRRKLGPGRASVHSHTGRSPVAWHPSGEEVLGIHGDRVYKWSPLDNTYEEVKDEKGIVPHDIMCSPNGQVFITSDVYGTIKIFDTSSMTLIYKMTSQDSVNRVCFSPNGIRFYDLRGAYCNIWEPTCLRLIDDAFSERNSARAPENTGTPASFFWSEMDDPIPLPAFEHRTDCKAEILAIAEGSKPNELLACANKQGVIQIYKPPDGPKHEIKPSTLHIGLECLIWDPTHVHLAYSLVNGRTCVKKVATDTASSGSIETTDFYIEKKTSRGRSTQLLFNDSGKLLLVQGVKMCQVLSLADGEVIAELRPEDEVSEVSWHQHLSLPDRLLCFEPQSITVYSWRLEKLQYSRLDLPRAVPTSHTTSLSVDLAAVSNYSRHLLLRTTYLHLNSPKYKFHILSPKAMYGLSSESDDSSDGALVPLEFPQGFEEMVEHVIGILPNKLLVFLSNDLEVCTTSLRKSTGEITRHFFLPRDWVTSSSIRLCRVLRDGTFLCPTKGEVALIESDLASEW